MAAMLTCMTALCSLISAYNLRQDKEGEWQLDSWYMDNMDGGEQREKDLAEDLEEQGCKIEWQEV